MLARIGEGLTLAGLGGLFGAKAYAGKKYLDYRRRRDRERQGIGLDRRQFAKLPRKRQQQVLYYRRSQVRDLENVYRAGYHPRRQRRM